MMCEWMTFSLQFVYLGVEVRGDGQNVNNCDAIAEHQNSVIRRIFYLFISNMISRI